MARKTDQGISGIDPYYDDSQKHTSLRSISTPDAAPDVPEAPYMGEGRREELATVKTLGMVTYTSGVRKYSGGMDSCGGIC